MTPTNPFFEVNAFVAVSPGFSVMGCSPDAGRLFGTSPRPGDPCALENLFTGKDLHRARDALDQAMRYGRSRRQTVARIVCGSGRSVPCEYATHPLFKSDGSIAGVMLRFRDLPRTESAGPHAAAPGSGRPARPKPPMLLDDLPRGVFTVDTRRRITSFNRTAEKMTAYRQSEILGRHCWEVFQTDLCDDGCPLCKSMERGEIQEDFELTLRDAAGRRKIIVASAAPLKDETGRIVGAVETFSTAPRPRASEHTGTPVFSGIIGKSTAMRTLFEQLPDIAASDASVLICGESGTGKDLVARAVHELSERRRKPFIAVNCAALAESLLESELFGHEKGAFTGASRAKAGRFELAAGGTLFLDEIGELKPALQVKLLRVLEERQFERVGGTRPVTFNARVIAATNRDLKQAMAEKRFRRDLFYRLRTVPVTIPPLRERPEDIAPLVAHFIEKFNRAYGKNVCSLDPKVMRHFEAYHWPGNVRELERCIEHAFVFVKGPVIFRRYLPDMDTAPPSEKSCTGPPPDPAAERKAILHALTRARGVRKTAADRLGISRTTLWRRMKALGIA